MASSDANTAAAAANWPVGLSDGDVAAAGAAGTGAAPPQLPASFYSNAAWNNGATSTGAAVGQAIPGSLPPMIPGGLASGSAGYYSPNVGSSASPDLFNGGNGLPTGFTGLPSMPRQEGGSSYPPASSFFFNPNAPLSANISGRHPNELSQMDLLPHQAGSDKAGDSNAGPSSNPPKSKGGKKRKGQNSISVNVSKDNTTDDDDGASVKDAGKDDEKNNHSDRR